MEAASSDAQIYEGLERGGTAGPHTLGRLVGPRGDGARSDEGPHIEVDLDRQIGFIITRDGSVSIIKRYNEQATPSSWNYTGRPLTV